MIDKNRKVVFSQHARDRFPECGFTDAGLAVSSFRDSVENNEIKKYKDMTNRKSEKYNQNGVSYRRNGTIIFTYTEKIDRFTKVPIYVVITVTNQLASSGVKI